MESGARSLLTGIFGETFDVEEVIARRAAALLVKALDAAGLVIMPIEPTTELVQASMMAMRQTRYIRGNSADEIQAVKHTIRYRAMVEKQRGNLGLSKNTRPAAAKRARRKVLAESASPDGRSPNASRATDRHGAAGQAGIDGRE